MPGGSGAFFTRKTSTLATVVSPGVVSVPEVLPKTVVVGVIVTALASALVLLGSTSNTLCAKADEQAARRTTAMRRTSAMTSLYARARLLATRVYGPHTNEMPFEVLYVLGVQNAAASRYQHW